MARPTTPATARTKTCATLERPAAAPVYVATHGMVCVLVASGDQAPLPLPWPAGVIGPGVDPD